MGFFGPGSHGAGVYGGGGLAFSPAQINGLKFWLDAADLTTVTRDAFTTELGGIVTKDGSAIAFTPVTASKKFTHDTRNGWNGKPTIQMNNAVNYGLGSPAFDIATLFGADGKSQTVFLALHSDDAQYTFGTVFYQYVSGATGHYFRLNQSVGNVRWIANATTPAQGINADYLGRPRIICLQRTPSTLTIFINGQQETTVASTATAIPVGSNLAMYLGTATSSGGGGMIGDFAEMLVYDSTLSPADRYAVEDYLANKWLEGLV